MENGAGEGYIRSDVRHFARHVRFMEVSMYYLSTAAMLAVVAVLFMGLWVMMRGTSPNLSQKLMRWRVGLQFAAVVLLVVYAYIQHH